VFVTQQERDVTQRELSVAEGRSPDMAGSKLSRHPWNVVQVLRKTYVPLRVGWYILALLATGGRPLTCSPCCSIVVAFTSSFIGGVAEALAVAGE